MNPDWNKQLHAEHEDSRQSAASVPNVSARPQPIRGAIRAALAVLSGVKSDPAVKGNPALLALLAQMAAQLIPVILADLARGEPIQQIIADIVALLLHAAPPA